SRALPVEAIADDGDGVALALIVANEHRAGLEAAPWRAAVPRQAVKEPQAFPIKPAKGPLLQAISDHSPQQVLAQICCRGSSEDHAPVSPKRVTRKRAQMRNLGLDRGRVCRVPPCAQTLHRGGSSGHVTTPMSTNAPLKQEKSATETRYRLRKPRECRANSRGRDMAPKDRTAWLGM